MIRCLYNTWEEYIVTENFSEELINEDVLLTSVLATQMMVVSTQIFCMVMQNSDFSGFNLIDTIKNWWKDIKANKIIKKLAQDEDIKQFLKDNEGKQGKGWRDLLRSKLSENEYEYITRITQNKTRLKIK